MIKKINSSQPKPPILGQHWLVNQTALKQIIASIDLCSQDNVLEIGVGTGQLTDHILDAKPKKIIGLEYDSHLVDQLQIKYRTAIQAKTLEIVLADCRHYDLSLLPTNYKLYTNTPYYLAANLLRRLVDEANLPIEAVLLLPQAVVTKLTAPKTNFLGCLLRFKYRLSVGLIIGPQSFRPPPKVKSQVLIMRRRSVATNSVISTHWSSLTAFTKAGFCQPRRLLVSNLFTQLGIDKIKLIGSIQQVGYSPRSRPADLSPQAWIDLYQLLGSD